MEAFLLKEANEEKHNAQIAYYNQKMKSTEGSAKHPKLVYAKFEDLYSFSDAIDRIRANSENDYVSEVKTKVNKAKLIAKRMKEFDRLEKAGKIIPWSKRKKQEQQI